MTTANYPSDYTKTEKEVFDKSAVVEPKPPGRLSAPKSGVKKLLNYPIARRNEEKLVQYLQNQLFQTFFCKNLECNDKNHEGLNDILS